MGYYGLNSFDEVAKRYADTKPIRGARASEDLRPLGQRRYWWSRVAKVNDNKYILLDGHWAWSGNGKLPLQEMTCPISWERKEDGDYITIRSHFNNGISVSRYTFLDAYLPKSMSFDWYSETGKHYVVQNRQTSNEVRHYLPKFKGNMDWANQTFEMVRDSKVVFKAESDGQFTRVNELQPYQTRRIDKDLDTKYAGKVTELWEWAQVVLPILGQSIVRDRDEYANKLTSAHYWYWSNQIHREELCAILDNPEHEKRMALAVCLACDVGAISNDQRFEHRADTLYQVKQAIRKAGKFYQIELR